MTQSEWYERIKSWVPDWMFEQSSDVEPIFQALALIMSDLETERDSLISETFIDESTGSWVDTHGHERSISRALNELDVPYRLRVRTQNLKAKCDPVSIKAIVDALLIRGEAQIREDFEGGIYFGRGAYFNRGTIVFETIKDAFTIVVDRQYHEPYSYMNRGFYFERSAFIGDADSNTNVFYSIIQAVNDNRAFGALFRIVERFT